MRDKLSAALEALSRFMVSMQAKAPQKRVQEPSSETPVSYINDERTTCSVNKRVSQLSCSMSMEVIIAITRHNPTVGMSLTGLHATIWARKSQVPVDPPRSLGNKHIIDIRGRRTWLYGRILIER